MPQAYEQTIQTDLLPWTAIATAVQQKSSELNCLYNNIAGTGKLFARLGISFGLDSTTAPVGTQILVQRSNSATGDADWYTIDTIVTGTVTPTAIVMDNTETAGATVIECGAGVPALNDLVFFKNATITNSEIGRVTARVATGGSESFTVGDALSYTQSGTQHNKAEIYDRLYDLSGCRRLRCVVNNNYAASSASCCVRITCTTVDAIKSV